MRKTTGSRVCGIYTQLRRPAQIPVPSSSWRTACWKWKASRCHEFTRTAPLLYSVATGNPTAVDQSFFASLNEDDEMVLDVDEGDARRVAGDSVMDDVADVDGDHVQSVSEHAENSDGVRVKL